MELLADRDPEEAGRILDQVLEQMMDAVHRYEGTVNQVMGDGIMALFGAPLAHEDHAVRAAYAALRMQERIGAFGDLMQRAAGRAAADPRGTELGRGDGALHRERPVDDLHRGGTDRAPRRAHGADGQARARSSPPRDTVGPRRRPRRHALAGPCPCAACTSPVEVHEVTGAATAQTRAPTPRPRAGSRRSWAARRTASGCWPRSSAARTARAGGGDGRRGGRGEVAPGARARPARARAGRPGAGDGHRLLRPRGRATAPGIELQPPLLPIEPNDNAAAVRDKLARRHARGLDPGLEDGIARLRVAARRGRAGRARSSPWIPAARRLRAVEVLVRVVEGVSRAPAGGARLRGPPVARFRRARGARVSWLTPAAAHPLVATYRPEHDDGWSRRAGLHALRLEPLRPDEAGALLDGAPRRRRRTRRRSAASSPSAAAATRSSSRNRVRSLVETGVLAGTRGAYRVARPRGDARGARQRARRARRAHRPLARGAEAAPAGGLGGRRGGPGPAARGGRGCARRSACARARPASARRRAARRDRASFPIPSTPSGTR